MTDLQKIRNPGTDPVLEKLLASFDLTLPEDTDDNLGLYENGALLGCGFLKGNMIQCLAIDKSRQREGLSAVLVTALIKLAAARGIHYLRVITKPSMAPLLSGLGLQKVADASPYAVFLEFGRPGSAERMAHFRALAAEVPFTAGKQECTVAGKQGAELPAAGEQGCAEFPSAGKQGASCLVMNCNPFTLGHRWLIEQASRENPWVWVLAVEEDRSLFPFKDRLHLMEAGTGDLKNVRVIPGGEYVISSLTFPAYFTRNADLASAQGALDAAVFAALIAPALGVRRRYVGTEPLSLSTELYNQALRERLPQAGIELVELDRISRGGRVVSASAVREGIVKGDWDLVRDMVPDTTWEYLRYNPE
ncbi:[citrate (pro-3S)-lyase] ligase [Treponema primitia ZAS-2]|uniref:[citrate (Pro-3S)-lyase] ligase n=1 Tax=Treponema primitia (strain ATCC BAA-887 / DSM 12427 / ZAS-2) TaxID=545694 RepID=F5YRE4_TREPZ|nr:[citrate (pro-3S)-lyase] ligase [Treponema primitia]AEF84236.1 [citrate (pro-3S)-lyase] ligase [Treponema primitia ZAS-2]